MTIAQSFLAEIENESRATRKFLERVPADKLTWKPAERSMTLGQLALHIAAAPGMIIQMAAMDRAPVPDFNHPQEQPETVKEINEAFEASLARVNEILPTIGDEQMFAEWTALRDGNPVVTMPRIAFLRNVLLNHTYHHRGQMSVYLRMLGVKVPSPYGPSADELPEFLQTATV